MEKDSSSHQVTVAAVQCALNQSPEKNVAKVIEWVEQAAHKGAQIILPPELFETHYFPFEQNPEAFQLAKPVDENPLLEKFSALAKKHQVVIPVSFFEKDGPEYYNSVAIFDADGDMLGVYRKSHIPDGPGYQEKFFFKPGDTGFKVWKTKYANIGVGICWDQWFPEAARAMVLKGADLLFYPTAIGSEPNEPEMDSSGPWTKAMVGHAVSNATPVIAANRIGQEQTIRFYGFSFISDQQGNMVSTLGSDEEGIVKADFSIAEIQNYRANWGFFRDRRPTLYKALTAVTEITDPSPTSSEHRLK